MISNYSNGITYKASSITQLQNLCIKAAANKNKLNMFKGNGYKGNNNSSPWSMWSNRQIEDKIIALKHINIFRYDVMSKRTIRQCEQNNKHIC